MHKVYILKLSNGAYYVGSTGNIQNRLKSHSAGQVYSTKNKLPFTLLYTEDFENRSMAQKREYQIKNWKKRRAIERLISLSVGK